MCSTLFELEEEKKKKKKGNTFFFFFFFGKEEMWAVEDKASKSEIEAQIDTMAIEIQFSRYVLRLRG